MFQVNPLLGRGFTWKIKPYFLRKLKYKIKMSSAAIFAWRFKGLRKLSFPKRSTFFPVWVNFYLEGRKNINGMLASLKINPSTFTWNKKKRQSSVFLLNIYRMITELFSLFVNTFADVKVKNNTLSYIVFKMAQSEPSSAVKGKAIYNKNLSN